MNDLRRIDPEGWYNEALLRAVYGIAADALDRAFESGELPRRELGVGTYLYRGQELLDWFERKKRRHSPEAV